MKPQIGRIEYIDALKGFAIMCVVLGHITRGYLDAGISSNINQVIRIIDNIIYAFHMPLFFAISGYVYSLVYFDSERLVKKEKIKIHLLDLVCLYVVFSILIWAFKSMGGDGVNHPVSWSDLLMIWAVPIYPYWYLYVLIVLYLIFIPLITKRTDNRIVAVATVVLCAVSNMISTNVWLQVHNVFYYALFFWLGLSIQQNDKFLIVRKWGSIVLFTLSVLLIILLRNNIHPYNLILFANAVIALGIISGCWYLFSNINFKNGGGILSFCGRYSLEIYLIHCFIAAGMRIILSRIIDLGTIPIIYIVANFLLSLLIPILLAYILKKINLHRLIFKPYTSFSNAKGQKSGHKA